MNTGAVAMTRPAAPDFDETALRENEQMARDSRAANRKAHRKFAD